MVIALAATVVIFNNVSQSKTEDPNPKCKCEDCKCVDGKCTPECMKVSNCTMDSACCDISKMNCEKKENHNGKCCEMKKEEYNKKYGQSMKDSVKLCPVTGETIEGEGAKFTYMGKEYTFCCEGCISKFKSEPANYTTEITCPIKGDEANKDISTVYNGVKYYFCCPPCIKKFEAEPEKYLNGQK